jgi:hypothetical protein
MSELFRAAGGAGRHHGGGERRARSSCAGRERPCRAGAAYRSHVIANGIGAGTSPSSDEEVRLHERLLDRDRSALLECLDRFGHVVHSTSLATSDDSASAEAVTERVFVELWRRPEAFHPRYGPLLLQLVRATLRSSAA